MTDPESPKVNRREMWQETLITSQRSFESYERLLGFSEQELEGKTILDLGAGANLALAEGAKERNIDAAVTSLNPQLAEKEKFFGEHLREKAKGERAIAGIAQALPFRDAAFDRIYSLYSVPLYLPTEEKEYRLAFEEMIRVLKPGGEAVLFPCDHPEEKLPPSHLAERQKVLAKTLRELEKRGIEVKIEELPEDTVLDEERGIVYRSQEGRMARVRIRKPMEPHR